jgi:hypothetical protein
MDLLRNLADNPIFVKHVRSRLRRSDVISTLLIVGVLLLMICWWGIQAGAFVSGGVFTVTLVLQGIILLIAGSGQIATSVSGVRASGILDFHRISPLPPTTQAAGFLLGAPVREYIAYALTLPVSLACVAQGGVTFLTFLQFIALSVLLTWALHAWTMVAALYSKRPTKNGPIGLLVFLGIMGFNLFGSLYSWFRGAAEVPEFLFFGQPIPWLAFAAVYLIPIIFFGMLISTRKIRSERTHPLSKVEAVAFLAVTSVLTVGGLWPRTDPQALILIVLYVVVVTGIMLSVTITPTLGEYARGLRRATRRGLRHLPYWDELALNRPALSILCLVALITASATWNIVSHQIPGASRYSLAIAVGVLTIASFGLGWQYFSLVAPKRASTLMVLYLFFAWVVPLVAAIIGMTVSIPSTISAALSGFTPLTGLAFISGNNPFGNETLPIAQIAALIPAIGFTSLYFFLVTGQRRKIDNAVRSVMIPPKPTNPFDPPGITAPGKLQTAEL